VSILDAGVYLLRVIDPDGMNVLRLVKE